MPYDPKDIPATLDVRNAEVRLYHMWDESLVGVARQRHAAACLDLLDGADLAARGRWASRNT